MDPISALSLAANIFQVIGFTNDVVTISKQIYDAGSPAGLSELEQIATDALNTADDITTRLRGCEPAPPGSADSVLLRIGEETVRIAQELKDLLEKLRAKGAGGKPWHTLHQTFMTIWKRDDIDKLEKRLVAVREELQFHVVALIQKKLDYQSLRLQDVVVKLDDQAQAVVPQLFGQLDKIKTQNDTILDNQMHSETVAHHRHEELMGAVKVAKYQRSQLSPSDTERMIENAQTKILVSLWFATMQDREDNIQQAYDRTYEWLFCDPVAEQKPWDNFRTFLLNDAEIYWITGKAGSGKSTLAKFAAYRHETSAALLQWAGGKCLNRASFYFYYKGAELEKSEVGVLRSLLHQVLSKRPKLIKSAFLERFEAIRFDAEGGKSFIPTYWELKRALEALLKSCPDERFFFSVDGLDEYDADNHQMGELVDVFEALSKFPNVKFLLTSRPWPVFKERLAGYPRLRLHELTRPDIAGFVDREISEHMSSREVTESDDALMSSLKGEIVENSSGVFLWVYLVVRSLLEGLYNGDSIGELRKRILELPTDLEDLYLHMWIRIPERYKPQVSRILQILSFGTSEGARTSLLGLALAEDLDEEAVFTMPVAPLKREEAHRRMNSMEVRINARCLGIIEVQHVKMVQVDPWMPSLDSDCYENRIEGELGNPFVTFIHRTVFEFASSPEVCVKLKEATSRLAGRFGDVFQPESALLRLLVLRIKTFAEENLHKNINEASVFPSSLEGLVYYALGTCRKAEKASGKAQTRLVTELDKTMTYFYNNVYDCPGTYHWSNALRLQSDIGGPAWIPVHQLMRSQSDMLSLAVRHGLVRFVKENEAVNESVKRKPGRPLLDYALRPGCKSFGYKEILMLRRSSEMVAFLLKAGARPSQRFDGKSLMEHFVWDLGEDPGKEEVVEMIVLLLPYVQKCKLEVQYLKQLANRLRAASYWREMEGDVEKAICVLHTLQHNASLKQLRGIGESELIRPRPRERPTTPEERPKTPEERSKIPAERSEIPEERPKSLEEGSKSPNERSRTPEERPKSNRLVWKLFCCFGE
ncbi:uncharacterized protein NECHADRAFT_79534 [Fusarium vanettenii 77-13-4]|uniref:NACHT domain-containing protein n=1 Tax=Fusarium vanettenii (strain ATCC MYA-4622 / CBS 123669 / FGSC 9596 / NRRL 45880 / 77-13-4) TaxID=660122 RepID=C7Z7R9_FUSV7|nr:uncharacterized protein NECHADRAFT_79534 [Fusarium vanettenii 77-13-4]EEU39875.1 hypothetical protein NECHADRAFT_79534 [Fusarium vanettenii 77-13-4]